MNLNTIEIIEIAMHTGIKIASIGRARTLIAKPITVNIMINIKIVKVIIYYTS